METLLISFLIHSFFGYSIETNQKPVVRESLPFLYTNLKLRAKFQISRLLIRESDWLNFIIHFYTRFIQNRLASRHLVISFVWTFYIWPVHSFGNFTFGQFTCLDILHLVSLFVWTFYFWSVHLFGHFTFGQFIRLDI